MPIFEYVCAACSHSFETIVLGSDAPECPSCRSRELTKRLSVFAVGGRRDAPAAGESRGPCGTCGDPRGPGSCSWDGD